MSDPLRRERLERVLTDPSGPPITLVVGPPGSGKTTLLVRVSEDLPRTAWHRIGPEDTSAAGFIRRLGQSLARASLVDPAVRFETVAELIEAVSAAGTLVIDDLHELAGSAAEPVLERLLSARPAGLRVLLGSREPPRLNITRMLVSGDLQQLDAEDLRFRSWEVEDLFRAVYGAPLSPESAAALTRRTGGWAAGLQLFRLATAGRSRAERERAIDQLNGRTRLVRSYLARNVLDGLEPIRLDFLLRCCTLGVMTPQLCDRLLDRDDSADVLAELEQTQFFTVSTDGGLSYRFHQVLQTHLEVLLIDQLGAPQAREVYGRAGALLEADRRWTAAVGAYARGEDWGAVARLLQREPTVAGGDETWWGVLALPGAPADDPGLVLAGARRLARDGQLVRAVAAYRHAEGLTDDREFRGWCADERAAVAMWLSSEPTDTSRPPTRHDDIRELRLLTRTVRHPERSSSPLARGIGWLLAGEPLRAVQPLRLAAADTEEHSWRRLVADLAAELVEHARGGTVAASRLEEIVLGADLAGLSWLSRLTRSLQSAVLLADDPTPWRCAAAEEFAAEPPPSDDAWGSCLAALALGWALGRAGRTAAARTLLDRASALALELSAPVLGTWVELARDHLFGAVPDPEVAARAVRLGITVLAAPQVEARVPRESSSPVAELWCLGGLRLRVGRVDADFNDLRPRPRALLQLLAMNHCRDLHREQLIELLWPDLSLIGGIRSLQVAVSNVRRCLAAAGLPEAGLRRHGDAYALRIDGLVDHTAGFERGAQQALGRPASDGTLEAQLQALAEYGGDLLPEAGLAEWVLPERDRLRQLAATLGVAAARTALVLGRSADGIGAARRSLQLDAYHDPAWEVLIGLHEQAGDWSGAEVVRAEHDRIRAELGLPPAPRTSLLSLT